MLIQKCIDKILLLHYEINKQVNTYFAYALFIAQNTIKS